MIDFYLKTVKVWAVLTLGSSRTALHEVKRFFFTARGAARRSKADPSAYNEPAYIGADLEVEMVSMWAIVIRRQHEVEQPLTHPRAENRTKLASGGLFRTPRGARSAGICPDLALKVGQDFESRARTLDEEPQVHG